MNETATTPDKLLLSAEETAMMIGVHRTHIYALHNSGRLPLPVRLGRRTLWRAEELRDWTQAGCPDRRKWLAMQEAKK
jgi:predicted DNA-binding transcriptional regulator AlpA